jgi:mRNA interferase RelE/StbE
MNYQVSIRRRAQKFIAALSKSDLDAVWAAVLALAGNPRPHGSKKLTDRDGWRIRVRSYRVVYEIDDVARKVTVLRVGHRRDIYR